jgi:hypothetical protein
MDKVNNRFGKWKIVIGIICVLYILVSMYHNPDIEDLGGDFTYDAEQKDIIGIVDIPPQILSFDYDKRFIIVKQRPSKYHNAIYDKREYFYPLGRDTIYYWLIIKKEQKVLGPLMLEDFNTLRAEYNVSEKLHFQEQQER